MFEKKETSRSSILFLDPRRVFPDEYEPDAVIEAQIRSRHAITAKDFKQRLRIVIRARKPICTSEAFNMLEARNVHGDYFVLGFDDGYKEISSVVMPIMQRYGIPFTVFAVVNTLNHNYVLWFDQAYWLVAKVQRERPALAENLKHFLKETIGHTKATLAASLCHYLKDMAQKTTEQQLCWLFGEQWFSESQTIGREPYLSWGELIALCKSGLVEVGSHTTSHSLLSLCSEEQIRFELEDSRQELQSAPNQPVDFLSYPNGQWTTVVANLACQAGYRGVFAIGRGNLTDCFCVRRMDAGIENIWKFAARHITFPRKWFCKYAVSFIL